MQSNLLKSEFLGSDIPFSSIKRQTLTVFPVSSVIFDLFSRKLLSGLIFLADMGLPGSIHYYNGSGFAPNSQVQSKQHEDVRTQFLLAMRVVCLRGSSSAR